MAHAAGFPGLSSSIKDAGITQDELLRMMLSPTNEVDTSQQLRAVLSLGEDEFGVLKSRMLRALVLRVDETPSRPHAPELEPIGRCARLEVSWEAGCVLHYRVLMSCQ